MQNVRLLCKLKLQFKGILGKAPREDPEGIKGILIYGIFWNFICALASQGFPLIAVIITARLLGKFNYGQLGMINSTVIMFSTFAGLGLGITATKFIAELYHKHPERTGCIMGLTNLFGILSGTIMCITLFIMAPWLASNALNEPNLIPILRIASLLLIFNTIAGVQSGSIAGFGAFRSLARIAMIQGIISASLTVIGVYFFGLLGAVIAMVINSIINIILYKLEINNLVKKFKIKIDYARSWGEKDVLWKLSIPSMLSNVMVGPIVWISYTIIINTAGGYDQLGLFNAANQWRVALSFLPMVIGGVLLPMVSANLNKECNMLEAINVLAGWIIVTAIALPLISFPEIIAFFYGRDYFSIMFLQSLALMMLVSCILSYKEGIGRMLVAKNLMWWGFLSNLIWGILFLGLVIILKNLGSLGLAISYIVSYSLNSLIFVPFYLSKNVVPRNLIASREVMLIWILLLMQTTITILNTSLHLRFICLLISIMILALLFHKIWNFNMCG